jgi:ribosomal protein S21
VRPYLEKNPSQKKGLAEWLKAKALSSNPSTEKKKKASTYQKKQLPESRQSTQWESLCQVLNR